MLLDNVDVAILTKFNELAGRYGIKSYECLAALDDSLEINGRGLSFVVLAETAERQIPVIKKMLGTLGVSLDEKDQGILKGGEIAVVDALDNALRVAPNQRPR